MRLSSSDSSLLSLLAGFVAFSELTQLPEVSAALGQMARITCHAEDLESYYAHWYQQKTVQTPKLIVYNDRKLRSEIAERFSGSCSGVTVILTITRAQVEDYYCFSGDKNTFTVTRIDREVRHKPHHHLCHSLKPQEDCEQSHEQG